MGNLKDTAEIVQDLYYQNYKSDEDFFTLLHFRYLTGVALSKLLEDEYKEARKVATAEEGIAIPVLQDDWYIEETVKMERQRSIVYNGEQYYIGELSKPLFRFPYDADSFGVQTVTPAGETECSQFIRTSAKRSWMSCRLPFTTRGFFYVHGRKISIRSQNNVDQVTVTYIPEVTDEVFGEEGGPVPKSKEELIIRKTLDLMIQARQGVVVDMSNDSNPNKIMQSELNTTFNGLKTKPI